MIQDLSDFKWPEPIKTDQTKRDRSKKCAYHKDYGHTTKQCKSLHYLVEKLIRAGHLKQYVSSKKKCGDVARNLATTPPTTSAAPRAVINSTFMRGSLMKNTTINEKGKGYFKPPPYKSGLAPSNPD